MNTIHFLQIDMHPAPSVQAVLDVNGVTETYPLAGWLLYEYFDDEDEEWATAVSGIIIRNGEVVWCDSLPYDVTYVNKEPSLMWKN